MCSSPYIDPETTDGKSKETVQPVFGLYEPTDLVEVVSPPGVALDEHNSHNNQHIEEDTSPHIIHGAATEPILHKNAASNPALSKLRSIQTSASYSLLRKSASQSSTKPKKAVRQFYERQENLMQSYVSDAVRVEKVLEYRRRKSLSPTKPRPDSPEEDESRAELILAKIVLVVNVFLLAGKTVVAVTSGSLSVISSVVDSAVDLVSGAVIWITQHAIKHRDPYLYPRGRTRLEPVGLVVISVVMAVASIQVMVKAVETIVAGDISIDVNLVTVCAMVAVVVTKFGLAVSIAIVSRRSEKPSNNLRVLALDQRNDCVSNAVAIGCAYIGAHVWSYADPIGGIVVALVIAVSWFYTGWAEITKLSGLSAKPDDINRIIKLALEHDPHILFIDTVLAYHYGTKFLVELHICMDGDMTLRESHDIAEALQTKVEHLDFVERAFLHIDYEVMHRPEEEHKIV